MPYFEQNILLSGIFLIPYGKSRVFIKRCAPFKSFNLSLEKVEDPVHVCAVNHGGRVFRAGDHGQAIHQANPFYTLSLVPPLGDTHCHGSNPFADKGALFRYITLIADWPMSGNETIHIERLQKVQGLQPPVRVRRMKPGLTFTEYRVSDENDFLLGNPDGNLPLNVPGIVHQFI